MNTNVIINAFTNKISSSKSINICKTKKLKLRRDHLHEVEDHLLPGRSVFHQSEYFFHQIVLSENIFAVKSNGIEIFSCNCGHTWRMTRQSRETCSRREPETMLGKLFNFDDERFSEAFQKEWFEKLVYQLVPLMQLFLLL